ncbi:MAG TPA: hypothetical protein P5307_02650 [Pirellulaceae bacterium]|nr:hypothetical protein [Planctomycetales bacterium]MCB9938192.1 hypothetical protein [Planctomycetaceae bacterium]HRX77930.1 hypothetical protein [Pirellulaceae bacterium]
MKNLFCLCVLTILCAPAVHAQDTELPAPSSQEGFFIPDRNTSPPFESRSYQSQETARELVHRNAALRAAQRRERMAINAAFGYSPSRPPSSTVPAMSSPTGPPTAYRYYPAYPGFLFPRPYSRF